MPTFLDNLPEAFVSNTAISALVHQAVKDGKIRKIGSRLYTKDMSSPPEDIVKRNWYFLLRDYYPDALISDRTAIENKPAADGSVFIVSSKKRETVLPGIRFKPRQGVGALETDRVFVGGCFLASTARAYLENMRVSRGRGGSISRTLTRREMEERLEQLLRQRGEPFINSIRDQARDLAKKLEAEDEYKKLDELIGSLLGTRDAELQSAVGKARKMGAPYDPVRLEAFIKLFEALHVTAPVHRSVLATSPQAKANLAFFEAYFSNFIEGTEFGVDEAMNIVFAGQIPSDRPEDAHDVLGTFRIVADDSEMGRRPKKTEELKRLLKSRHAVLMQLRPDKLPGLFKEKGNQAGTSLFVAPELVEGTLEKGFDIYRALEIPFYRAVFMMFLISEIHPFADGNGRTARIMMNAELVAAGEQRMIIPTVFRNNYLSSLRALTHNGVPEPLIRTLDFAQRYTRSVNWDDFAAARRQLNLTNAFLDPNEADDAGKRLVLYQGG